MKKFIMQKRIAILSSMAVAAYCFMILSTFASAWDSYRLSFWMGYYDTANERVAPERPDIPKNVQFVSLKPAGGYLEFSGRVQNDKDNSLLDARFSEVQVALPHGFDPPRKVVLYYFYGLVLSFLALYLMIALPVKFARLMLSVKKQVIFNGKNVNRIRSIGFMAILIYISTITHQHIHFVINQTLFDFPDYIIYRPSTNATLLVVGMAVLVMAEILSKGLEIKREQELTI